MAHKDIPFIWRLAKKLTVNTDNHCYIHIDAKSHEPLDVVTVEESIHWIENRYPVYWGGYNYVLATLALFEEAVKGYYDRYMILQGADYPLYDNGYIESFFEDNKETEFINAIDESVGDRRGWYRYIPKYYLDDPNFFKRVSNRLNADYYKSSLPKFKKSCEVSFDGKRYHIYRGWAHFSVTHSLAEYIVGFSKKYPEYNNFFKHVYAPDESYFHTIVYNSEYKDKTPRGGPITDAERSLENLLNLTYFEYPSTVREFTQKEDYEYLKGKGYLFFRKVSTESRELLDYIDACTNS